MFGRSKIKTLEAQRDDARAIAERQLEQLDNLRSLVRSLESQLNEQVDETLKMQTERDEARAAMEEAQRERRIVGNALNEALAERDQLKAEAQARRAKQLANLRNQKPKQQPAH